MRVDLEFAHATADSVSRSDVERSCAVANALYADWSGQGHEMTASVLVDDKHIPVAARRAFVESFLASLTGPPVSYYCFERDLTDYADDLVALLPKRRQRGVAREIQAYLDRFQALPCSVDIAIWHLLRVGLLTDHRNHMDWMGARDGYRPPDLVVSVLGDQSAEFEQLAQRNMLDHIPEPDLGSRLFRVYYPETLSAPLSGDGVGAITPTKLQEVLDGNRSGN